MRSIPSPVPALAVRPDWLSRRIEEIIEPDIPIVDAHHHLLDRNGFRYLLDELAADTSSGHAITATVFVEWFSMYREDGAPELRPVGETEFAARVATTASGGSFDPTHACAAIVGYADLRLGARVERVLEAHIAAGEGRFRGIRHSLVWDADPALSNPAHPNQKGLMADRAFREGFSRLAPLGLSFDAMLFHPQLDEFAELARAFPETRVVLNHVGAPLGIGSYAGRSGEIFADWSKSIRALAAFDNVCVKLGGLGMRLGGFNLNELAEPPSSEMLATLFRPYFETCIEAFGPARCMFESNFPVDKGSYSYAVFWNACKRLAAGFGSVEKNQLFSGTATSFYRLDIAASP